VEKSRGERGGVATAGDNYLPAGTYALPLRPRWGEKQGISSLAERVGDCLATSRGTNAVSSDAVPTVTAVVHVQSPVT
jgi:hypothetical protein